MNIQSIEDCSGSSHDNPRALGGHSETKLAVFQVSNYGEHKRSKENLLREGHSDVDASLLKPHCDSAYLLQMPLSVAHIFDVQTTRLAKAGNLPCRLGSQLMQSWCQARSLVRWARIVVFSTWDSPPTPSLSTGFPKSRR